MALAAGLRAAAVLRVRQFELKNTPQSGASHAWPSGRRFLPCTSRTTGAEPSTVAGRSGSIGSSASAFCGVARALSLRIDQFVPPLVQLVQSVLFGLRGPTSGWAHMFNALVQNWSTHPSGDPCLGPTNQPCGPICSKCSAPCSKRSAPLFNPVVQRMKVRRQSLATELARGPKASGKSAPRRRRFVSAFTVRGRSASSRVSFIMWTAGYHIASLAVT